MKVCQLYRVGPSHPWDSWHGDVVAVVEDDVPGDCPFEGCMVPQWGWLAWLVEALDGPCIWHEKHVRVRGPWSGVIPADGLEPLMALIKEGDGVW